MSAIVIQTIIILRLLQRVFLFERHGYRDCPFDRQKDQSPRCQLVGIVREVDVYNTSGFRNFTNVEINCVHQPPSHQASVEDEDITQGQCRQYESC